MIATPQGPVGQAVFFRNPCGVLPGDSWRLGGF